MTILKRSLLLLLPMLSFSFGCEKRAAENTPFCTTPLQDSTTTNLSLTDTNKAKDYLDLDVPISWQEDIEPFLSSKKSGEKYDCTTCHDQYKNIEALKATGEIDRIIDSFRTPGAKQMPRLGDTVPSKYIVMLKRWQKYGFPQDPKSAQQALDQAHSITTSSSTNGRDANLDGQVGQGGGNPCTT